MVEHLAARKPQLAVAQNDHSSPIANNINHLHVPSRWSYSSFARTMRMNGRLPSQLISNDRIDGNDAGTAAGEAGAALPLLGNPVLLPGISSAEPRLMITGCPLLN